MANAQVGTKVEAWGEHPRNPKWWLVWEGEITQVTKSTITVRIETETCKVLSTGSGPIYRTEFKEPKVETFWLKKNRPHKNGGKATYESESENYGSIII